jgi:hypothetical protein
VSCNDQGRIAFWHLDTFLVRNHSSVGHPFESD